MQREREREREREGERKREMQREMQREREREREKERTKRKEHERKNDKKKERTNTTMTRIRKKGNKNTRNKITRNNDRTKDPTSFVHCATLHHVPHRQPGGRLAKMDFLTSANTHTTKWT